MQQQFIVQMDRVSKFYGEERNRVQALKELSFTIKKGDFVAICGPSGSGKTTALNLIGALDKADSGKVFIAGRELGTLSRHDLTMLRRHEIGFVFQSFNLIPVMTVQENAEFTLSLMNRPRAERRERARQIIDAVGLHGLYDRFPHQLSGGQQQRAAIARAIAPEPKMVLADEPTANLDTKNALSLIDLMLELNREQGMTFVFSTHDQRIMERASRVIKLMDGELVEDERFDHGRAAP
jgi:putative ABC transport system ATP-binding protein